jgi:hypothetical protein
MYTCYSNVTGGNLCHAVSPSKRTLNRAFANAPQP